MSMLAPREAYRRWAPTYGTENAITLLEARLVEELGPSPHGRQLLDVGCGTGRRLIDTGAVSAVGVDLCPEMLEQGQAAHAFGPEVCLIVADARTLPLPAGAFDLVWCRLVIGHLPDCRPAYRELARVAAIGESVIVTDFHPAAYAAGHRRSFRHKDEVHEVEHHVHTKSEQIAAATDAGLTLLRSTEAEIGPAVRHFYEQSGRDALYADHHGLPIVSALAFVRHG